MILYTYNKTTIEKNYLTVFTKIKNSINVQKDLFKYCGHYIAEIRSEATKKWYCLIEINTSMANISLTSIVSTLKLYFWN